MPSQDGRPKTASNSAIMAFSNYEGIERVEKMLEWCVELFQDPERRDWSSLIVEYLSVHSHSSAMPHPSINFRFTVQPIHCNAMGNLHGGCTGTIFDFCTSLPLHLVAEPGFWSYLGVTRTLNVTYLRPVPLGATIDILCEILSVGKRLSTIKGEMREVREDGQLGALLATCEHGKVNTDPPVVKL